ncbi:hypothetical protein [Microbacterium sp. NPDC057650]|uniref:hypothetical protein n=1 Tax=unclassified Microbacterium TaxID=2609290 RepID=UPI003671EB89
MTNDRDAVAWARGLPEGARAPWAELEALVFRGRPRVLAELGGAGAFRRRSMQARSPGFLIGLVLAALPALVLVLLPVLAFTTLGGTDFGLVLADSAVAVPTAGWLMAATAGWQAVTLMRAAVGRSIAESEFGGWVAVVVGAVTAVLIWVRGAADQVPGWPGWTAAAALTVLLGAAVVLLAHRARRSEETRALPHAGGAGSGAAPMPDADVTSRRIAAIAAIPAQDRERIRAELAEAIGVLRRRGIISPEQATRALQAELGSLAQRMTL